jgi:hypothetical protein
VHRGPALKVQPRPVVVIVNEVHAAIAKRRFDFLESVALTASGLTAPLDAQYGGYANIGARRERLRTPAEESSARPDQVSCDHPGFP